MKKVITRQITAYYDPEGLCSVELITISDLTRAVTPMSNRTFEELLRTRMVKLAHVVQEGKQSKCIYTFK